MAYQAWVFRSENAAYSLQMEDRAFVAACDLPPDSVLIRVRAVSLNYRDIIAWKNYAGRKVDGRVPASDGSGEIIACGSEVRDFQVGDRVAGCFFPKWHSGRFDLNHHKHDLGGNLDGMLQQTICLPQSGIVPIPNHMDFEQASTLPCAALTAWHALIVRGNLAKGSSVLCLGTGGVSIFALQFALAMGCQVLITSSDDRKLAQAKSMGASHCINYRTHPQWSEEVWRLTGEQGVDHVVEVGGPGTLEQSMKAIAAGGQIALIGVLTGFGAPNTSLFPLLARNVRLDGIYVGPRDAFMDMNCFLEREKILPIIDQTFDFDQAPIAFEYLHSGKHFGKVVIRL